MFKMENIKLKGALGLAAEYSTALQAEQEFKTKHWKDAFEELKTLPSILNFAEEVLSDIPVQELDFRNKLILSRYLTFPGARTRKKGSDGEVKSLPYNIGYRITNSSKHPFPYKALAGDLDLDKQDIKSKTNLLSLETKIIGPKETATFSRYEMYLLTVNPLSNGYGVNFEVRFRGVDLYIVAPTFSTSDDFNVTPVIDECYELKKEFLENIGIRIDVGIKNWDALSYNKKEVTSSLTARLARVHKSFKGKKVDIQI
jgi:hypothetical protein